MKHEDWKIMLSNWENSKKNKQLQTSFNNTRSLMIKDEQLLEIINSLFEYDEMTDKEKEELDFIEEALLYAQSKESVLTQFIQQMVKWAFYLYSKEKEEKYEICALIIKAVEIEKREIIRILDKYYILLEEEAEIIEAAFDNAKNEVYKQQSKNDGRYSK
jgi:hypothetical protein